MGRFAFPVWDLGRAGKSESHAPNEKTYKKELVEAALCMWLFPTIYVEKYASNA